jgi:hypothetical protein
VTTYPVASITGDIAFFAGIVQNTSFAPAPKSILAVVPKLLLMTVSLDKVSVAASVTVPIPTSNSSVPVFAIQ